VGHQQLLFTLLAVCVVGIMISVGVITLQEALRPDNRTQLTTDLLALAREAQAFYRRPMEQGGGEGTFLGLTTNMKGIQRLTSRPSNAHGDYFVKRAGNLHSVELLGVGVTPGRDPRYPVRLAMLIWPDSTIITTLN
jgi:type II secretory pathway pseudopilin PulG